MIDARPFSALTTRVFPLYTMPPAAPPQTHNRNRSDRGCSQGHRLPREDQAVPQLGRKRRRVFVLLAYDRSVSPTASKLYLPFVDTEDRGQKSVKIRVFFCHLCYHSGPKCHPERMRALNPGQMTAETSGPNFPKIGDFGSDLWVFYRPSCRRVTIYKVAANIRAGREIKRVQSAREAPEACSESLSQEGLNVHSYPSLRRSAWSRSSLATWSSASRIASSQATNNSDKALTCEVKQTQRLTQVLG